MKSISYNSYGTPEVLQYIETEEPFPNDHEVLVAVKAASLNSSDLDMLTGKPYIYRLLYGVFKPSRKIIGGDIAGKVVALGNKVKEFKIGDEVMGDLSASGFGAFAEYVCVPEKALVLKPASMPFTTAAALPQAAVLAWQALRDKRPVKAGDKVLINGAGGGVGTFAIQMAKLWGAEVTAVDSTQKLDALKSLGADHVIDYRQSDFTQSGQQYDLIIDVVARRSIYAYRRCLKPQGIFVLVGGSLSAILQAAVLGPFLSSKKKQQLGLLIHEQNKCLLEINALVSAGKIKAVIEKTFPLNEVPSALSLLAAGKAVGKLVVTV